MTSNDATRISMESVDTQMTEISMSVAGTNEHDTNLPQLKVTPRIKEDTEDPTEEPERPCVTRFRFLGMFFTLAACVAYSFSALIIKILNFHPFNIGFWRFALMALLLAIFIAYQTIYSKEDVFKSIWPVNKNIPLIILQSAIGANSIVLVLFGLKYLDISDTTVIYNSSPIFVTLFAFLFIGERCGIIPVATAIIALIGVGIVCKPPILTGNDNLNEDTLIGVATAFTSMLLMSVFYVTLRYLREVHHALVNLAFAFWGFVECGFIGYWVGVLEVPSDSTSIVLIITTALLGFFAQTCLALALKYEQAGPVALFRTTEVLLSFMWQMLFLNAPTDIFSVIGAVVTLSGVLVITLRKIVLSLPEDDTNRKRFRFLLL